MINKIYLFLIMFFTEKEFIISYYGYHEYLRIHKEYENSEGKSINIKNGIYYYLRLESIFNKIYYEER